MQHHERMIHHGEYFSPVAAVQQQPWIPTTQQQQVSSLLAVLVPLMVGIALGMLISASQKITLSSSSKDKEKRNKRMDQAKTVATRTLAQHCEQQDQVPVSPVREGDVDEVGKNKKGPLLLHPTMKQDHNIISKATTVSHNEKLQLRRQQHKLQQPQSIAYSAIDHESGLVSEQEEVPKHIAVIMDGNRRYGREKYNCANRGHLDGSKTLVEFSKWCLAEGIQVVTVYAFSTENWNRCPSEINALMNIFSTYCDELRVEAQKRRIKVQVWSTDSDRIPNKVAKGMQKLVEETKNGDQMVMNVCVSYGSRGEIINACKEIANDVQNGVMSLNDITEASFQNKLLTRSCPDPDIVIRTSGEYRLSNFLLWQIAYSEMFFLNKTWPEVTKEDFLGVIRQYARERKRRFGK